ncbi:MAG: hypothetical protein JJ957_05655 [Pseudomonadales bacterium]|nr:hypothetical protein [Pseudomonadales bacterium]MBO6565790.1 hypothetical protein [Pseudomonadales bacterium]MBO6595305.1 hypothetical protein [Pseudomonadales bacterium]MBO6821136.1 hypothetical protein [Pseudomonadales bacterium]
MTENLSVRLLQIEGYAKALVQALREMDQRRHILEPLLAEDKIGQALSEKFKDTHGVHAYKHLVPILAQDLVRDLSRLILDGDKKAASLKNLHRKARAPEIRGALRERFKHIPDKWHGDGAPIPGLTLEVTKQFASSWRDKDRSDYGASFDQDWEEIETAMAELEKNPTAEKIKTFRDRYHAHHEMARLGQDPVPFKVSDLELTINDLFEFADEYMNVVLKLARLLTGAYDDVESFSLVHRKQARDMWAILAEVEDDDA